MEVGSNLAVSVLRALKTYQVMCKRAVDHRVVVHSSHVSLSTLEIGGAKRAYTQVPGISGLRFSSSAFTIAAKSMSPSSMLKLSNSSDEAWGSREPWIGTEDKSSASCESSTVSDDSLHAV